ncbi:MAG TPA: membrane protein insertase YidC [Acidimicrobiales bacterium]|nr:membrane protein insertase YidC [Acidimicrobiales bacterium]
MDFLFDTIASVLAFFYDLTSSFGGAILLLTLTVMVVVTPLTLKSTRSMIAMQRLQPELRKLQAKYKDDRQKLNEEMMAFYKEHNINPLGGCLPLVVQMPVFFVLYRVLVGMVKPPSYGYDMGSAVGLAARNPSGGGTFSGFGTFDPGYLDHSTALYKALNVAREMNSFGLDLADTFTNRLSEGLLHAIPYLILVVLIGVTAWYQQRQIQARNSGNQPQINPQQQMLMKVLPFFLPLISLTLPAGIVLYFLVSNLYRIGQQAFITRTMYSGDKDGSAKGKGGGKGRGPVGSGSDGSAGAGLLGGLLSRPGRTPADDASADDGAPPKGSSRPSGKGGAGRAPTNGAKTPAKGGTKSPAKSPAKGGGGPSGTTTKATAPARQAPSRTAPSNQNRSKKKRKRN